MFGLELAWYVQLSILLVSMIISFALMYQIDFHRFMRATRVQYAQILYIVLSIVVGFIFALFLLYLTNLFVTIAT